MGLKITSHETGWVAEYQPSEAHVTALTHRLEQAKELLCNLNFFEHAATVRDAVTFIAESSVRGMKKTRSCGGKCKHKVTTKKTNTRRNKQ